MSNIYITPPCVDNEDELLYHQVQIFKRTEREWYIRHGINGVRSILDIGCGTGQETLFILEQFPHVRIHAVDSNPDYVERCRKNTALYGDRVTCSVKMIELIEMDQGQVDAVICRLVWMHVDPIDLIRAIHRILKPNGLVFFLTSENQLSDCIRVDFIYDVSYLMFLEAYDQWHAMRLNSDIISYWKEYHFSVKSIEVLTAHTELDPPESFRQKLHPKHMYGVVQNNILSEEAYQTAVAVFEKDTSPLMMVSHLWAMVFCKN